MASNSEVGHQKNLANFGKLIDLATQIGTGYNPSNQQITVAGLTNTQIQATADYNNWIAKLTTWKSATNDREIAFEPVQQRSTQISDNVNTLNVAPQTMDDVEAIVHKIHGYSKKIKKAAQARNSAATNNTTAGDRPIGTPVPLPTPPNLPTADGISTSQQSYDAILANFDKLVQDVQGIPSYNPNEAVLTIASLQALYNNLKALNLAAVNAYNALVLARNQRDTTFYTDNTGLYDVQKKVKMYIRQIMGSTSSVYHAATALKFVKIIPRKKKLKK